MTILECIKGVTQLPQAQMIKLAMKEAGVKMGELAAALNMKPATLYYQIHYRKGGVGLEVLKKIGEM